MDVGEFAKSEMTITPAANGSYLVRRNWNAIGNDRYLPHGVNDLACFTDYSDLLNFLCEEYRSANARPADGPTPPQDREAASK